MTICNNRLDTPLHNAARWNHPSLVSELLLYGARYTATNNDNKTPVELTSDDQVKELIWKATQGIIAVGSYSPLIRRSNSFSRGAGIKEPSPLTLNGGVNSVVDEGANKREMVADKVSTVMTGASELIGKQRSHNPNVESHVLDVSEYDVVEEELVEHRALGKQQVAESKGQGSEGDPIMELREEGEPGAMPRPKGEGRQNHEEGVVTELKEVHGGKGAESEGNSHSVGAREEHRSPKRDDKLISLLKAIEDFDR